MFRGLGGCSRCQVRFELKEYTGAFVFGSVALEGAGFEFVSDLIHLLPKGKPQVRRQQQHSNTGDLPSSLQEPNVLGMRFFSGPAGGNMSLESEDFARDNPGTSQK